MKKLFGIIGLIALVSGVLSLLLSLFYRWGYYHLMDGSAHQYTMLRERMLLFLIIGIVLGVAGLICMVIGRKC